MIYANGTAWAADLLTYTSEPMAAAVEITGTVEVELHVESSEPDVAFFAYVEVVAPDGKARYITEGMLRSVHRAECATEPPYPTWGPCHSFERVDGLPLIPGEVATVRFGMFNTSVLVPAGHRIRISLAGHDGSVFDRYPAEGQPRWTIHRSPTQPSSVSIPMRVR